MNEKIQDNNVRKGDKILLLEDNRVTSKLVSHTLKNNGYNVLAVDTRQDLLNSLDGFEPQIVILDNIPNLPCTESCVLVKCRPSSISTPVIIYSGICEETDVIALLKAGADRVIPKDYSPLVLAAEINALLRLTGPKKELHMEDV